MSSAFCTCEDLKCPFHPTNHDKGCSPCISKNLKLGEIPSCFFNKINAPQNLPSYTMEDFAKLVLQQNKNKE